jgi:hypothetical protein
MGPKAIWSFTAAGGSLPFTYVATPALAPKMAVTLDLSRLRRLSSVFELKLRAVRSFFKFVLSFPLRRCLCRRRCCFLLICHVLPRRNSTLHLLYPPPPPSPR